MYDTTLSAQFIRIPINQSITQSINQPIESIIYFLIKTVKTRTHKTEVQARHYAPTVAYNNDTRNSV